MAADRLAMPFRDVFDCLWCGRRWRVRSRGDLEGWAALCPDCLAKADDNGFLRGRLRAALRERASSMLMAPAAMAATPDTPAATPDTPAGVADTPAGVAVTAADEPPARSPAASHEDWYLRRGRFAGGPITDATWQMELDGVTRWLDGLPLAGLIVELGAGSGWWSTLLASKGELWVYEEDPAALEAARRRLVAHGLLAHLHQRDPFEPPERKADHVVAAYLLGAARNAADLRRRLITVRGWLGPAGSFVFIEAAPDATAAGHDVFAASPVATEGPAGPMWPRHEDMLRAACRDAGLEVQSLRRTHASFLLGRALAATLET